VRPVGPAKTPGFGFICCCGWGCEGRPFSSVRMPHTLAVASWMSKTAARPAPRGPAAGYARGLGEDPRCSDRKTGSPARGRGCGTGLSSALARNGRRMFTSTDQLKTMAISLTESAANRVKTFLVSRGMAWACAWGSAKPVVPLRVRHQLCDQATPGGPAVRGSGREGIRRSQQPFPDRWTIVDFVKQGLNEAFRFRNPM